MANRLADSVSIAGVGCTRFGDLLSTEEIAGLSLQELAARAVLEAFQDAGMTAADVGAVFVGNVMVQSSHLPATYSQLSRWIGTQFKAGVHFDAACSTTNVGLALATQAIASGAVDAALVVGLEATRNQPKGYSPYERDTIPSDLMWLWTDMCVDQAYAVPQGYDIFTTYNGIVGQAYQRKYGVSADDYDHGMFELCRTRRLHGSMNPKAIIQETLEDEASRHGFDDPFTFWQSRLNPYISWPARYRSVVTPADGASAMVLVRTEAAKGLASAPVKVRGFGTAVSDLPWYDADPTDWKVDRVAFANAFEMAGIGPKDIDYLHTHDCSHIMGICMAETMGYLEPGTGLKAAEEGRLRFDGDRPMSTHGGRHAFGHAWAASAGADTYEAVKQLRGEAGERQIPNRPEIAVVATHGYAMISHTVVLQGELNTMTAVLAPVASAIERHYKALEENQLLGHKCTACGEWTVPITIACGSCGSGEYEERTLAGTGTLLYAAHNIAPAPHPRFADLAPYVFGHVILEEGVAIQGIIKGIEPTPEATRALFERGPVPVVLDVLVTADLPVVAFRFA